MAKYLDNYNHRRARCVICAARSHRRFRLGNIAGTAHPFSAVRANTRNRYATIETALKDW